MRPFDRRLCTTLPVVLVLFLVTRRAAATPDFPGVVAEHLQLATTPGCELCHAGTQGRGTVTTPFGVSMRSRGAQAYDNDSIKTALDALAAENTDSDGDGVPDIQELKEGTDPNGSGTETIKPEYGCSTSGKSSGADWLGVLVLAGAVLFCHDRLCRGRLGFLRRSGGSAER